MANAIRKTRRTKVPKAKKELVLKRDRAFEKRVARIVVKEEKPRPPMVSNRVIRAA